MSEYDERKSRKKSQKIRPQNSIDKDNTIYEEDGWDLYELHNILGNKGMLNWLAEQEDNQQEDEPQINIDAEQKIKIEGEEHTLAVEWQGDQFVVMRHSVPTDYIKEIENLVKVIDSGSVTMNPNIRYVLHISLVRLRAANNALRWTHNGRPENRSEVIKNQSNYNTSIYEKLDRLIKPRDISRLSRKLTRQLRNELIEELNAFINDQFEAIDILYEDHESYIGELYKLIPGRYRKEEEMTDLKGYKGPIATGEQGDPIPIKWYKKPEDYKDINLKGNTVTPKGGYELIYDGKKYKIGVSDANLISEDYVIRKVRSSQERGNQQILNKALKAEGYDLSVNKEDGDHVKDLGFDGQDVNDNYWPLERKKNQYAFFSYNPHYEVVYKKDGKVMKAPIGSLIGKHFKVKGFLVQGEKLGSDAYLEWLKTLPIS